MAALLQGDCREALAVMEPDTFDACVTDPPYELGFMGRAWDRSGVAFEPATWAAVLRVLKPGAHLVAFGAPKNYHRLACAIEDAGFEVRDCLMWIFGQGFPKNKNLLKPAYEPILLARKPGPFISLGIDACRIATGDDLNGGAYADVSTKGRSGSLAGGVLGSTGRAFTAPLGRWPANVVHDGSDEVLVGFPFTVSGSRAAGVRKGVGYNSSAKGDGGPAIEGNEGSAARFFASFPFVPTREGGYIEECQSQSDANTAEIRSYPQRAPAASVLAHVVNSALPEGLHCSNVSPELFTNETASELNLIGGSVTQAIQSIGARFWHASEPLRLSLSGSHASVVATREPTGTTTITVSHWKSDGSAAPVTFSITPQNSELGAKGLSLDSRFKYSPKASAKDRAGSKHPTVKPIALMRWLCRLITPPGGLILDPFAGSGTTGQAAAEEGFRATLIERQPEYVADITRRLNQAPPLLAAIGA